MIIVFFIILFISLLSLTISIILLNNYNKKTRKFHGYNYAKKVLKKSGLYKGIVAFGSARIPETDEHIQEIEEIGRLCAKRIKEKNKKISFITGGGPSVMTAWLKSAYKEGCQTAGFNICLEHEQKLNEYCNKKYSYKFTNFPARKQTFFDYAMCFIIFKGGFGTMDELFNLLCYLQANKVDNNIPLLVYPADYYKNVLNFDTFLEKRTINQNDVKRMIFCKTKEELLEKLYTIIDNYKEE